MSNISLFLKKINNSLKQFRDLYSIRTSGLFDKTWYLAKNPDVAQTKVDPLIHYLHRGGFEGRDPGPNFSSNWYLNTYKDVKDARINPLVHYLKCGKGEGRKPYPDPIALHQMGKVGSKTVELSLLIQASNLFDENWYLENYPDVDKRKVNPLIHYLNHGGFEGRDPGPGFSSNWYLNTYGDVKKTGINPLVHYLKHGKDEGRKPYPDSFSVNQIGKVDSKTVELIQASNLFDENWYLENYPDVAQGKVNPLIHYLNHGGFEGRDPGPNFSSSWYLDDIKKAKINPLVHYLKYGKDEGRKPQSDSKELAQYFSQIDLQEKNIQGIHLAPIIVHQMGKVGSKTIYLSLLKAYEALGIKVPICHAHALAGFDERKQSAILLEHSRRNMTEILAALGHGEEIRKQIDDNPSQHWNLITLVRDPIGRNIAMFFHNLPTYIPDWYERYTTGKLNVDELQAFFLSINNNDDLTSWFRLQIQSIPAFSIDVYAEPFPKELGYKIYPGMSRARLLLIRLENLTECAECAMREFLGLENFTLHNKNIGEEKKYADVYRAFKSRPLPPEYVQRIYNTQIARHFYTDTELFAFAKRWTRIDKLELAKLEKDS